MTAHDGQKVAPNQKIVFQEGPGLGRIGNSLVNQHNRNIVPHRIDAVALHALQALPGLFQLERLFAGGTNQNVKQVLRDHASHFTPSRAKRTRSRGSRESRVRLSFS
jgi:hypothetical protein